MFRSSRLLFEITSAFGTCGMSLGVTSDISSRRKSNHHGTDVHRAGWAYFVPLYIRRENEEETIITTRKNVSSLDNKKHVNVKEAIPFEMGSSFHYFMIQQYADSSKMKLWYSAVFKHSDKISVCLFQHTRFQRLRLHSDRCDECLFTNIPCI